MSAELIDASDGIVAIEGNSKLSPDELAAVHFQTANDPLVRKMAIVADVRWEALAIMFTAKGVRPFPIEYFRTGQEAEARLWLNAKMNCIDPLC